MHTARNIFKRENFNMKNTETAFDSFLKFGYLSLHIGGNGASVEVFLLFSSYLKDKAFKHLKHQSFFLPISSNVSYIPRHRKRASR